jgi:sugar phosphate isomerase/epimerase
LDSVFHSSKNRFPFRLGTTSYVFPTDLVANAEALSSLVDDVELVLFEIDGYSNLPDPGTVQALRSLTASSGLSYTVHFPSEIRLGTEDSFLRRQSVEKCLKVFELTLHLEPAAYILHFEGDQRGGVPSCDMRRWIETLDHSVEELLRAGLPSHLTCVETLDYPFEMVEGIVADHNLSICLDIGHLFLYGYGLKDYLARYAERCRVFHLHGIKDGEDHRHIRSIPQSDLLHFLSCFHGGAENQRIVTLEVFSEDDLIRSIELMNKAMIKRLGNSTTY